MALTKVSTDGVKDDAITSGKIPANAVGASELADNAVDTNAIANNAVTAGKTSGVAATINNNANNRIITGSDTANTLNGESALTFNNSTDTLQVHQTDAGNNPAFKSIHRGGAGSNINAHFTNYSGTNHTVILHDGSIGIGTQSPDQTLHVHKGSAGSIASTANSVLTLENSTDAILQFLSPSSNVNQIRFGDPSDNGAGFIDYDHNTNRLAFGTAGPERMRLDSSGQLLIGGTTLGAAGSFGIEPNGHVRSVLASGATGDTLFGAISGVSNGFQVGISGTNIQRYSFHNGSTVTARIDSDGLKFMNDTAAANALDDYEEGTHTLVTNANLTLNASYNVAEYTKVGNVVTMTMLLFVSSASSTNTVSVTLPFTNKSGSGSSRCDAIGSIMHNGVNTGSAGIVSYIGNGSSLINFYNLSTNGSWTPLNNSDLNANDEIYLTVVYRTA